MDKLNLTDFQKRKLKNFYVCIHVVTKEIKIRTDTSIANKTLYVLFGIDIMGYRQILGIYFDHSIDNRFWLEKFEDFKARNVEKIMYFVTPEIKNIERCLKIIYNEVKIVHSPDCLSQNIMHFFAERPSRKMRIALKNLYLAENTDKYKEDLAFFKEVYIDNQLIRMLLEKNEEQITNFYQYNHELRTLFYPYYTIEEMKKFLNKLKTQDKLCSNINEVIEFCLPFINSFETGRNYSRAEWLELITSLYEQFTDELEEYING